MNLNHNVEILNVSQASVSFMFLLFSLNPERDFEAA